MYIGWYFLLVLRVSSIQTNKKPANISFTFLAHILYSLNGFAFALVYISLRREENRGVEKLMKQWLPNLPDDIVRDTRRLSFSSVSSFAISWTRRSYDIGSQHNNQVVEDVEHQVNVETEVPRQNQEQPSRRTSITKRLSFSIFDGTNGKSKWASYLKEHSELDSSQDNTDEKIINISEELNSQIEAAILKE